MSETPRAPASPPPRPAVDEARAPRAIASERTGRPVRVLLVGPSLDILGGQAVQLDRHMRRLRETPGIEVGFLPVNPRLPGPLVALQRVKYVRTAATSVAYLWSLLRELPRWDVVHAFSASYWSYLLAPFPAMLVGRMYRRRVLLNYHSGEAPDHLARFPRSVRTMALAHRIAVPSGFLVDVFARFGMDAIAVFNFVDADRYPYRRREDPRPLFLANRNLEPHYNVACVVRAFARVRAEVSEARLVVAGFGSQRDALERLAAELGVADAVRFTGKVPPDEMARLYDEADVYLNAPNIDNMPLSVIESFAAGLPVVSTDAGGIPYIVDDGRTGLLVPMDDDAALAAAALRVLREPGLSARLSDEGRREVLEKYTWAAVEPDWERLYRDLAVASASGAR